jgi:hypothetical protein
MPRTEREQDTSVLKPVLMMLVGSIQHHRYRFSLHTLPLSSDDTAPTLSLGNGASGGGGGGAGLLIITATVPPGAASTTIDFPQFNIADSDSPSSSITITCTAPLGPGGTAAKVTSATAFPVGNTTVSCTATDPAGNTSPPQTFTVAVHCAGEGAMFLGGVCLVDTCGVSQPCHPAATCVNTLPPGAYYCGCNNGFAGNGTYCKGEAVRACLVILPR